MSDQRMVGKPTTEDVKNAVEHAKKDGICSSFAGEPLGGVEIYQKPMPHELKNSPAKKKILIDGEPIVVDAPGWMESQCVRLTVEGNGDNWMVYYQPRTSLIYVDAVARKWREAFDMGKEWLDNHAYHGQVGRWWCASLNWFDQNRLAAFFGCEHKGQMEEVFVRVKTYENTPGPNSWEAHIEPSRLRGWNSKERDK